MKESGKKSDYAAMNNEELIQELSKMRRELSKANETIAEKESVIAKIATGSAQNFRLMLSDSQIEEAIEDAEEIRDVATSWMASADPALGVRELSPKERQRLQGLGARKYGFIDEISDIMEANPQFMPSNLTEEGYKSLIRSFELIRNLNVTVQQVARIVLDVQLILGDIIYQQALSYYGSVESAARRRAPGAKELLNYLRRFFARRRPSSEEPTEHEVERDVRSLLHGRKEGEIIISAEADRIVKGNRTVIDETSKAKGAWKETEQGEIN